jgi:hypothetical protein
MQDWFKAKIEKRKSFQRASYPQEMFKISIIRSRPKKNLITPGISANQSCGTSNR